MIDKDRILQFLNEQGIRYKTRSKGTIETECPECRTFNKGKFLIYTNEGNNKKPLSVCWRGSCSYGSKDFYAFYATVAGTTIKEAHNILDNGGRDPSQKQLRPIKLNEIDEEDQDVRPKIEPIKWPPDGVYPIGTYGGKAGEDYLKSRGVDVELAKCYNLGYNPIDRRVYFPIIMNNECYGFQKRAIDKVEGHLRMLNNTGFQRANFLMFCDRLKNSDHAIIAEGPFDSIKFHHLGGNICTMGKKVTQEQINLIIESGVKKIYLALDEDAAPEMRALAKEINNVFIIKVPQAVKDRCLIQGKKADFGECTFEECKSAFESAKPFSEDMLIYLKSIEDIING